jgi:sporulation protein YtfJ
MMEKNEKIQGLMDASLGNLNILSDMNCVIGKPIITASGCQIIPFSKVTMGNLSGGGEYGDVKVVREADSFPFAGGAGAVVSMKPLGFLVDDGSGCKILKLTEEPLDSLVERAGDIMRDILSKN